jgi:hypothetical protein
MLIGEISTYLKKFSYIIAVYQQNVRQIWSLKNKPKRKLENVNIGFFSDKR